MRVLSLFDGISAAAQALKNLGISTEYYASEIDKYSIQVSQKNHPEIIQIGDIKNVNGNQYKDIDLLIGGSPCQDLTSAGKTKGLKGERSILFFEYVRILKECRPKYFILENVASMSNKNKDIISEYIGMKPLLINSAAFSAQHRKRLYWTNIPISLITISSNKQLKDILEPNVSRNFDVSIIHRNALKKCWPAFGINNFNRKSLPLLASYYKQGPYGNYLKEPLSVSGYRTLTLIECERLQEFPDNYTEGVSKTQRYKMLGNSFTVSVIEFLMNFIINKTQNHK